MTEFIQEMLAWISANPHWAYLIIFLVAMTESLAVIGMFIPGAVMMVGAGPPIAAGVLGFWPVMAWAAGGAIVGDGISYWLGHHYRERLRLIWPFSRYPDSLARGERFFEQYGGKSVAFGRFVGPVRAVIPVVAGMMGMDTKRFLAANVLSALAWAPAYIVPGIVLGASLELAAEATARLGILALALILTLWFVFWGVHRLFLFYSPRAGRWVQALLSWADVHPRVGEIARALADPHHPDARALARLAGLLLLGALAFALMMGLAIAEAPELRLNQMVLNLALSLHTPGANHLMIAASRLGDLAVILPLGIAVLVWLLARGQRRQAGYWIAALAFGLLAPPLLKWLLQVPRPDIGLEGLSSWAFPSGHVLRATVTYGFLAVCLAGAGTMPQAWRWLPYALAAMLATAVAIARLYLGAHWLTDVVGALALGLAWIAALGLLPPPHPAGALLAWLGGPVERCPGPGLWRGQPDFPCHRSGPLPAATGEHQPLRGPMAGPGVARPPPMARGHPGHEWSTPEPAIRRRSPGPDPGPGGPGLANGRYPVLRKCPPAPVALPAPDGAAPHPPCP